MSTKQAHGMSVSEVDTKRERRRKVVLSVLALVLLGAIGGGAAYGWWYFSPPPMPESPEEAVAVVQTPQFKRLSAEEKMPYLDRIREQWGSADPEQQRVMRERMENDEEAQNAMRDAMRTAMERNVRNWARSDPAARAESAPFGNWGRRPQREQQNSSSSDGAASRPRSDNSGSGDRPARGEGNAGNRPERTPEQQAEQRQRGLNWINEWITEGDSQVQSYIGEYYVNRRRVEDAQENGN